MTKISFPKREFMHGEFEYIKQVIAKDRDDLSFYKEIKKIIYLDFLYQFGAGSQIKKDIIVLEISQYPINHELRGIWDMKTKTFTVWLHIVPLHVK